VLHRVCSERTQRYNLSPTFCCDQPTAFAMASCVSQESHTALVPRLGTPPERCARNSAHTCRNQGQGYAHLSLSVRIPHTAATALGRGMPALRPPDLLRKFNFHLGPKFLAMLYITMNFIIFLLVCLVEIVRSPSKRVSANAGDSAQQSILRL
jgi:hypothetical protein